MTLIDRMTPAERWSRHHQIKVTIFWAVVAVIVMAFVIARLVYFTPDPKVYCYGYDYQSNCIDSRTGDSVGP